MIFYQLFAVSRKIWRQILWNANRKSFVICFYDTVSDCPFCKFWTTPVSGTGKDRLGNSDFVHKLGMTRAI